MQRDAILILSPHTHRDPIARCSARNILLRPFKVSILEYKCIYLQYMANIYPLKIDSVKVEYTMQRDGGGSGGSGDQNLNPAYTRCASPHLAQHAYS